jgi:hypothetical protein
VSDSNVTVPITHTSFRDLSDTISPSYLKGPIWSAYRYSISIPFDAMGDAAAYANLAGLPSKAPVDGLPFLSLDRQIFQGYAESTTGYIARLIQWLDLWARAGSSMGVMLSMLGFFTPLTPKILAVKTIGTGGASVWDTYQAGANPFPAGTSVPTPPDHLFVNVSNWRWDGSTLPFFYPWMRWREWIVIFSPAGSPWAAPTATWGSFHWGDGTCYGWTGTPQQAANLTQLAKQWKSAGCWIPWIIVTYDSTMFDSSQAFGSGKLPDNTWGFYGKVVSDATYGKKYVSARPPASTCTMIPGTADGGGVLEVG